MTEGTRTVARDAREGGSLDNNAVNVSTPDQTAFSETSYAGLRAKRWAAREVAQRLTHRRNVAKCGRVRMRTLVELRMVDDRASYGGLVTCGAVWLCPVCQAKIAAHRALEVAAVTEWAEREGVGMYFGALTVAHGPTDALSVPLGTLRTAWRRMIQGRSWEQIVDDAGGEVLFVRALEINIGANGWHPHMHPLVLLPGASASGDRVAAAITRRWRNCVERAGGHATAAAQKLERVERIADVGAYITDQTYGGKGGRVDLEMTASQSKRGFSRAEGTRSHWSILEDLSSDNADNAHYVNSNPLGADTQRAVGAAEAKFFSSTTALHVVPELVRARHAVAFCSTLDTARGQWWILIMLAMVIASNITSSDLQHRRPSRTSHAARPDIARDATFRD